MAQIQQELLLQVVFLLAVPAVVGPLASKWAGDAAKRKGATPARVRGIHISITVVWVAVLFVGLSTTLGRVSFLSTLTFSAIAGIGVTLALQTTLQNLVSGVILLQRGFLRVGDTVQFSGLKGRVVSFGLVTTVLRLDDGSLAFVSNSNLLSGPLLNATAASRLKGEY